MLNEDSMRSSFEFQLKEAKNRAELFSRSLQDAREQEAIALKILEEERSRWTQSFEEKSIMIEQLERELTSTVEALDYNRKDYLSSSDTKIPLSSDIKLFSNEEIDKTLNHLVNEVHYQLPIRNASNNLSSYIDIQKADSPSRRKVTLETINPIASTNQDKETSRSIHYDIDNNRNITKVKSIMKVEDEDDTSMIWRDLLNQYKDQLKKLKIELEQMTIEKEQYEEQMIDLKNQLHICNEEREQYQIALQNAEGKLQFRITQIIEYEEEKEVLLMKLKASDVKIEDLTKQVDILKHDLIVASTELRVYTTRATSLETKLNEMILSREDQQGSIVEQFKASENQVKDLYKQLKEVHQSYSIQLEESKRMNINMQMIMKDIEQKCEGYQIRAISAEHASSIFKAERDALLAMVSKFHSANGELSQSLQSEFTKQPAHNTELSMKVLVPIYQEQQQQYGLNKFQCYPENSLTSTVSDTTLNQNNSSFVQTNDKQQNITSSESSNNNSSSKGSSSGVVVYGRKLQYTPPVPAITNIEESVININSINKVPKLNDTITPFPSNSIANPIDLPNTMETVNIYTKKGVNRINSDNESTMRVNNHHPHEEYEVVTQREQINLQHCDTNIDTRDDDEDVEYYPESITSAVLHIEPSHIIQSDNDNHLNHFNTEQEYLAHIKNSNSYNDSNSNKDILPSKQLDVSLYTGTADIPVSSRIVKYKKTNENKKTNTPHRSNGKLKTTASLITEKQEHNKIHSNRLNTVNRKNPLPPSKETHSIATSIITKKSNHNKPLKSISSKITKQSTNNSLYAPTKASENKSRISVNSSLKELKFDSNTDIDNSFSSLPRSKQSVKVIVPRSYTLRDSDKSWTSGQNNSTRQSRENDFNVVANVSPLSSSALKTTTATTVFNDSEDDDNDDSIEQYAIENTNHTSLLANKEALIDNNNNKYIQLKEKLNALYKSTDNILSSSESSFDVKNSNSTTMATTSIRNNDSIPAVHSEDVCNNFNIDKEEKNDLEQAQIINKSSTYNNSIINHREEEDHDDRNVSYSSSLTQLQLQQQQQEMMVSVDNSIDGSQLGPSTIYSDTSSNYNNNNLPSWSIKDNVNEDQQSSLMLYPTNQGGSNQKQMLITGIAGGKSPRNKMKLIKSLKTRNNKQIDEKPSHVMSKIMNMKSPENSPTVNSNGGINRNKTNFIVTPNDKYNLTNKLSNHKEKHVTSSSCIVIPTSYSSSILHPIDDSIPSTIPYKQTLTPSHMIYPPAMIQKSNLTIRASKTDPILLKNHINKKKNRKILL